MNAPQFAFLVAMACSHVSTGSQLQEKPISKVVKLLQEMLTKSKADSETDTEFFAKYKCYCDNNAADKTAAIDSSTRAIRLLSAEIAELQGNNGKLSTVHAEMEQQMTDNERARETADSLRSKAHDSFVAEEADMLAASGQMDQAIETLSAVGGDQTAGSGGDNQEFMAGKSAAFLRLDEHVKTALGAASAFMTHKQRRVVASFLQAPFTGSYTSQSGEIVGIIKNMRDTFQANLASARASETADLEAYTKLSKVKSDEFTKMSAVHDETEAQLGTNDGDLSTKKTQKADAETSLANDEEFLAKLQKICAAKAAEFEDRKVMRANEDAAIAQAIQILNSDKAFDTMGSVGATSFLQRGGSARRLSVRERVQKQLTRDAKSFKSAKLARIASYLITNPFNKVVDEIDAMIELIAKEEKADDEKKAWCDSERETSHGQKEDKTSSINTLNGQITSLLDTLDSEVDGLRKQLKDERDSLDENRSDQATSVAERAEENASYQQNIRNLKEAYAVTEKATKVLTKFYDWLHKKTAAHHYDKMAGKDSTGSNIKRIPEASPATLEEACSADPACTGFNSDGWLKSKIVSDDNLLDSPSDLYIKVFDDANAVSFLQEDPAPPQEDGSMEGQTGKANGVVSQLKFILSETKREEEQAHADEEVAQHDFEDEKTTLKDNEATSLDTISSLENQVADKEKQLNARKTELVKSKKEIKSLTKYLNKIKPGCDFITENLDTRKASRVAETDSLKTAITKLKSTPAFKSAVAKAQKEALGECGEHCIPDMENLACQACIQGTSETAYCASHDDHPEC